MRKDKSNFFKKISLGDKKSLFKLITTDGSELVVKGDDNYHYKMVSLELVKGDTLRCSYATDEKNRLKKDQSAIVNFEVKNDRYFFQTQLEVLGNEVLVNTTGDVFILQRRKTPRLDIPNGYPNRVRIIEINGTEKAFKEGSVIDFSSGGCRASFPPGETHFKDGDKITIVLHLNHRRPIDLKAEVRHNRAAPGSQDPQVLGLKFVDLDSIMEKRLLILFGDIQREIFLKFS